MSRDRDIIIAGAGAAGLITALALAPRYKGITIIGPHDVARNGRTVALFEASIHILKKMDIWPLLAPLASPLKTIRFVDATQSLISVPDIDLHADEIDLPAFGYNIENAALVDCLLAHIKDKTTIEHKASVLSDIQIQHDRIGVRTAEGEHLNAALLIGADGKNSFVRKKAGIGVQHWSYPQHAITALLTHEKPHGDMSVEFHTAQGPCTLVPMRDDDMGRHRSSLVWLMSKDMADRRLALSQERLLGELERQVKRIYGTMDFISPRGNFPMAGGKLDRLYGPRIALVADAGHFFPPIGAQGLNLGVRDIATLAATLDSRDGQDAGDPALLRAYHDARKGDIALRTFGVDMLNRSLLFDTPLADGMRALGLMALAKIGPLRRRIMREGVMPSSFAL